MIDDRTILLLPHVAATAIGLGVAVFLDLRLLPVLRGRRALDWADLDALASGGRLVAAALAVLWLSGIGLVALAEQAAPGFLANPKLHAKLAIVGVLTVNGMAVHAWVMPQLHGAVGGFPLAGLDPRRRALLLLCGVTSAVSWGAAFLLGMVREMNHVVPAATILGAYAAALALAWMGAVLLTAAGPGGGIAHPAPASFPGLRRRKDAPGWLG